MFNFLKHKCVFCKRINPDTILEIDNHGIYWEEDKKWRYHQLCLDNVLNNPESFDFQTVDKALEIIECILEKQRRKQSRSSNEYDKSITSFHNKLGKLNTDKERIILIKTLIG